MQQEMQNKISNNRNYMKKYTGKSIQMNNFYLYCCKVKLVQIKSNNDNRFLLCFPKIIQKEGLPKIVV